MKILQHRTQFPLVFHFQTKMHIIKEGICQNSPKILLLYPFPNLSIYSIYDIFINRPCWSQISNRSISNFTLCKRLFLSTKLLNASPINIFLNYSNMITLMDRIYRFPNSFLNSLRSISDLNIMCAPKKFYFQRPGNGNQSKALLFLNLI